jgi:hypothetical protein
MVTIVLKPSSVVNCLLANDIFHPSKSICGHGIYFHYCSSLLYSLTLTTALLRRFVLIILLIGVQQIEGILSFQYGNALFICSQGWFKGKSNFKVPPESNNFHSITLAYCWVKITKSSIPATYNP